VSDEVRPHYKLKAWKEAMELVEATYQLTQTFPKEELFGFANAKGGCIRA
jgi:hypothetical protein